jgi:hypothetical protein
MTALTFAAHRAFDPEAIEIMSAAFSKLCAELGLSERGDRLTEVVARHVIEAAKSGLQTVSTIRHAVLEQFTANPQ